MIQTLHYANRIPVSKTVKTDSAAHDAGYLDRHAYWALCNTAPRKFSLLRYASADSGGGIGRGRRLVDILGHSKIVEAWSPKRNGAIVEWFVQVQLVID